MMIDEAIRNAQSDRQVCALLIAYMESLDPEMTGAEQPLQAADIHSVRARFRQLIHALDHGSTRDSDQRPVINQALHIYGEALSRLHALTTAQQETDVESMPYPAGMLPRPEVSRLAA